MVGSVEQDAMKEEEASEVVAAGTEGRGDQSSAAYAPTADMSISNVVKEDVVDRRRQKKSARTRLAESRTMERRRRCGGRPGFYVNRGEATSTAGMTLPARRFTVEEGV